MMGLSGAFRAGLFRWKVERWKSWEAKMGGGCCDGGFVCCDVVTRASRLLKSSGFFWLATELSFTHWLEAA
jgi:hypothetical protein